jgi:5-(carboxyamino)imidazole ribonucleotide mutase
LKVAVLMGSPNDREKMQPAVDTLEAFGLEADVRVLSAHRNPAQVTALASSARDDGYVAFICGAGMAAHLAGVVAAHTTLPVVGVPLSGGAINGVDALYSTVQMPKGIPVATVAIDGSMNAALLVVEMLAIHDEALAAALAADREKRRQEQRRIRRGRPCSSCGRTAHLAASPTRAEGWAPSAAPRRAGRRRTAGSRGPGWGRCR